ncbi:LysM peptidoglycan-binding domain-containing protein [Fibrella sp. HMF5335]|uniref:LysM peptidoglycan-binding domain-containing protein n=1 Tax=Fibrella rubiginis TaxID=2817060 RepID=A0A939GIZ7_9BACT|nr:LysM peptidoglycan-binding domain-containing protein [Fibrella rubiginis]MBO0937626.1 LysM peptidoglycan-binding domain-containing protein [Fibrella rubiginis]
MSIIRCCQILFSLVWLIPFYGVAQGVPVVGPELEFAGVSVSLTPPAQQRLQQEVARIYADRTSLRNALEQMRYVQSVIEPLLEEHNVPNDFRYLCLPLTQPGGGYWQIDNATKAKSLGLRVDDQIDERLNVSSASEAVLTELAQLHATQPNWVMALLQYGGYRSGTTAANTAPTQITLTPDVPVAVWATLARKVVYEREAPLVRPIEPYLLYDYRQSQGKSLATIARELGIDQSRFVPFNEWLRGRVIPLDKAYPVLVRLTPGEFLGVKSQLNGIVQSSQLGQTNQAVQRTDMGFPILKKLPAATSRDALTRVSAQFYEINEQKGIQAQPCDNAVTLAYYGKISVKSFLDYNDLNERDPVRPGEIYYLERKAKKAKIPFHVVQYGQTMRDVSSIYGIRLERLLHYNHMEPNQRVQSGRILWMQKKRPASQPIEYRKMPDLLPEPELSVAQRGLNREDDETQIDMPTSNTTAVLAKPDTIRATPPQPTVPSLEEPEPVKGTFLHEVRPGDTFTIIAQRYRLTVPELLRLNNWQPSKPLVVGQQLVVGAEPAATPPAAATSAAAPPRLAGPPSSPSANTGRPAAKSREYAESVVDVERKPVAPANPNTTKPATVYPGTVARNNTPRPVLPTRPTPVATSPATTTTKPGQRLVNEARVETPKVNGNSYYHIVQAGQTVYRVALINKVSVADVMRWNNLSNYTIEIGQRILIKK